MTVERTIPTQANTNVATMTLLVNGEPISEEIGIAQIAINKGVNKVGTAKVVLFDGNVATEDFELSAGELFKPGNELEIQMGYQSNEDTVFKGIVVKHGIELKTDQSSKLVLELKDASVKMTIGRKNRYFEDVTDSDVIEQLIGEYEDLQMDVEATTVTHQEMVQYFCTDWDFMLSRAEVNGQLVFVDEGEISIKAPSLDAEPVLNLFYGHNVFEFEAGMDARDQYAGTKGKAWNFISQEVTELEGSDPGLDTQGNITPSELAEVIGLSEWQLQHTGYLPDQELQAWIDAKLLRSRLSKIKGRVKIIGFTDIKPGDVIELGGFGDRFNGKAFVSSIYHEFLPDKKWYTHISFGLDQQWFAESYDDVLDKPASGLVPAIQGIHHGVVTNIHEDPDGEGRIRVRIPLISADEAGVWARIATLDAGLGEGDSPRGTFFNPEVGDEVVVGFFNDDPRDPVILGMLHSSTKPAPYEITEDNFEKGVVSRGQLKLTFNDDLKSITLETPGANKIVLNDDEGSILLEDQNGNKMQMNSDGITIESAADVNIKATGDLNIEGVNINAAAQAQLKAEGSGGAELSSSGQTVVKGSLVQIN